MTRRTIALVRALLAVCALGALAAQVVIPMVARAVGAEFPEVADLVFPYTAAAVLALVCVEVAIVALWRVLPRIDGVGSMLRPGVRATTNVLTACVAVATALSTAVFVDLESIESTGGPAAMLFLLGCVALGCALLFLRLTMSVRARAPASRAPFDALTGGAALASRGTAYSQLDRP